MTQLEMEFEQADGFYLAKREYEEALLDKKTTEALLQKFLLQINSTIDQKRKRMQAQCNHPVKHVEEFFDQHKRETNYTEYCDICGKVLRGW